MAYFADLTQYSYHLSPYTTRQDALNVGWLDKAEPFTHGPVSQAALTALALLTLQPVNRCRGWHTCNLGHSESMSPGCSHRSACANGELRVYDRDTDVWYAAPAMVLHYVVDHGYLPPPGFVRSLERMLSESLDLLAK